MGWPTGASSRPTRVWPWAPGKRRRSLVIQKSSKVLRDRSIPLDGGTLHYPHARPCPRCGRRHQDLERRHRRARRGDLAVAPGETVALVGESGSGKTTLLRLSTAWSSRALARCGWRASRSRGRIRWLCGAARLRAAGRRAAPPLAAVQCRAGAPAARLGAGPAAGADAEEMLEPGGPLSGDATPALPRRAVRRPAPAGGLRPRPRRRPGVVLLDEPFGALDALTRLELQRQFLELKRAGSARPAPGDPRPRRGLLARRPHRGDAARAACSSSAAGGVGCPPGPGLRRGLALLERRAASSRSARRSWRLCSSVAPMPLLAPTDRRRLQEFRGEPAARRDVRPAPGIPYRARRRAPSRPRRHPGLLRGAAHRRHRRLPGVHRHRPGVDPRGEAGGRRRRDSRRVRREFLARWDLWWLAPLGFENSSEIAVPRELAERERLATISDLARVSETPPRAASATSSSAGRMGCPGLSATYGLELGCVQPSSRPSSTRRPASGGSTSWTPTPRTAASSSTT